MSLQEQVDALPWYHRMELPGGVVTPGWAPMSPAAYQVPKDLTGKRVLDVGAWDGYWSFEAMKRGARQVVAIDNGRMVPERLQMARDGGAITIDNGSEKVYERLLDLTGGIGPDICIDAVGMEAHGTNMLEHAYDKAKTWMFGETERPAVVRQVIECCRKAGTVSIPGVYGGVSDKIPMGALMNKGLTIKTGQTHVHKYLPELLDIVRHGKIDPSFVVTHRIPLSEAAHGYHIFREKRDGCIKVVLDPAA